MVRDFSHEPVAAALVEQLLVNATRTPSAGYSQGSAFVVLTDPGQRRLFWETTSGPEWRGESESESLTRAPVVIIPLAHKQAYLDRYALPDKAHTPLSREDSWPAPYWDIDAGFGVMLILLTATDLGLGALFFAIFAGERALMDALGVPAGYRPIGAIAVGHPRQANAASPSFRRAVASPTKSSGGSAGDRANARGARADAVRARRLQTGTSRADGRS